MLLIIFYMIIIGLKLFAKKILNYFKDLSYTVKKEVFWAKLQKRFQNKQDLVQIYPKTYFTFLGIPGLLDPVEKTDPADSCLARGL